jgi:hypothetical protein
VKVEPEAILFDGNVEPKANWTEVTAAVFLHKFTTASVSVAALEPLPSAVLYVVLY